MDASLLNLCIGAAVYGAYRASGSLNSKLRIGLFILAGAVTAVLSWILGWTQMGAGIVFPVWMAGIGGGLTGGLLYWAETRKLFTSSRMKYSATILVSIVHSTLIFGLLKLSLFMFHRPFILTGQFQYVLPPLILYSFVSILGFSLLRRIFK